MVSYASEMEDFHKVLNALIEYPGTDVNIEIDSQVMICLYAQAADMRCTFLAMSILLTPATLSQQTASSIAAEGSNWKVLEDLALHGAKANDAALIEALAVHNHRDRSCIGLI
jgi:hypothetical protein